jgi:hypothetical protein
MGPRTFEDRVESRADGTNRGRGGWRGKGHLDERVRVMHEPLQADVTSIHAERVDGDTTFDAAADRDDDRWCEPRQGGRGGGPPGQVLNLNRIASKRRG